MDRSSDHILTTHVGALPGPHDVWDSSDVTDEQVHAAVSQVVRQQLEIGVDIVNEGELSKGGNWLTFISERLTGFEPTPETSSSRLLTQSADWADFTQFYQDALAGGTLFEQTRAAPKQSAGSGKVMDWICTGEITYVGQAKLQREIDALRTGIGTLSAGRAFLSTTAPLSVAVGRTNQHYGSDEEFVFALAEALRTEYEMIAQAGFLVQVDDAWMAALWDRIGIRMGLEAFKRFCTVRVEALNHALRNIPSDRVRYHLCWGSWHGPHAHDIPMADIVDVMLAVDADAYLFEAANARHEHEYRVWADVKLPEGKILVPGVVSHATPLIEHPELVAERITRFANLVGRENVIASTDCGLGLRCHPQIAWAKLHSLVEGARLASGRLW